MVLLILLSIVLQLGAAFLALQLIPLTGRRVAWVLIAVGMALMAARRFVSLFSLGGDYLFKAAVSFDALGLFISLLMFLGVWRIRHYFQDLTLAERELRSMGEALRESEEKFRSIVNSVPLGMHIYELRLDGSLVFEGANPAADKILGVDNRQFIGKTIEEAFPGLVDLEVPENYRKVASSGESWKADQITYQEGQIAGAFEVHAFRASPGKMVSIFQDVTERVRTEQALQRERDLIAQVMETSPAGIVTLDRAGKIVFANPRAEQVLGLERDEISHRDYNDPGWQITAFDGSAFPDDELPFVKVMRSGQAVQQVKHAIQWPDGRRVLLSINAAPLFDEDGQIDGMVTTVENVSAAVQAEEALLRRDVILQAINLAAERFLREADWTSEITQVLAILGEAAGASRVHVFENRVDPTGAQFTSQRFQWAAPGIATQVEGLQLRDIPLSAAELKHWFNVIMAGQPIIGYTSEFPAWVQEILSALDITSFLAVPIFVGGRCWGIMGFDDCTQGRTWMDAEVDALRTAARMFGTAIGQQQARQVLDDLVNTIEGIVWEIDLRRPGYTFVNRQAERLLGYPVDLWAQDPDFWQTHMHPDDREWAPAYSHQAVEEMRNYEFEYRMISADGQTLWFRDVVTVVVEADQATGLRGVMLDITERKLAEAALQIERDLAVAVGSARSLTEALDRALETALEYEGVDSGGVYLVNQESGGIDLISHRGFTDEFVQAVHCFEADTPQAELIKAGRPYYKKYSEAFPEAEGGVRENEALKVLTGIPVLHEDRVIACFNLASHTHDDFPPSTRNALEAIAAHIGGSIVRLQAEAALRQSQAGLSLAQEIAKLGSYDWDSRSGQVRWSQQMREIMGYLDGEPSFETMHSLVHPDDREKLARTISLAREQGEPFDIEFRIVRPDGAVRYLHDQVRVVLDDHGKPVHFYGAALDITDRKRAEESMKKRVAQLALLNDVGRQIAALLAPSEVVGRAANLIQERFGYQHVGIFLLNHANNMLEAKVMVGERAALYPENHALAMEQGMVGWVAAHAHSLLANDVAAEEHYVHLYPEVPEARSELSVPVRLGEQVLGVLDVQSSEAGAFDDNDVMVMETVAGQVATALENARLYQSTQNELGERQRTQAALDRRDRILEAVSFAAERFLSEGVLQDVVQEVLERLGQAADASRVYVFENMLNSDGQLCSNQIYEWAAAGIEAQIDNPSLQGVPYQAAGMARWEQILAHGEVVAGPVASLPLGEQELLAGQNIQSILIVPVKVGLTWWGFVGLDECRYEREWLSVEIETLRAAASILGAAIRRQQAELALREREASLSSIFRVAPVGIGLVQNRVLQQVNQRICEMVGFTQEELVGKSARVLYPSDEDFDFVGREKYDQIQMRGTGTVETRWQHRDGAILYVLLSSTPLDPSDLAAGVTFTALDISQRRRAEQELRERHEFLQALNEIAQVSLASQNLMIVIQALSDRLAKLINADECYITGWDDAQQRSIPLAASGEAREAYRIAKTTAGERSMTAAVLNAGQALIAEDVFNSPHLDPKIAALYPSRSLLGVPLQAGGQKLGAVLFGFRQTHAFSQAEVQRCEQAASLIALAIARLRLLEETRKRAEEMEALAQVSAAMRVVRTRADIPSVVLEQLLSLFDAEGAAFITKDTGHDGFVFEVGMGAWDQFSGKAFLFGEESEAGKIRFDQPYLDNNALHLEGEIIAQETDLQPILGMQCVAGAPLIADKRLMGGLWIGRNTEISEAELNLLVAIGDIVANAMYRSELHENLEAQYTTLQRTQARLVQSEKLAAIGELVAGVAHELNNPLTSVVLFAQLLQAQSADIRFNRDLDRIVTEAQRASRIVRGLLEFARQRPAERKPVQINSVLQGALELLGYELRTHNIQVETKFAVDLPYTMADPHQLQQVFVNIITNAWQAMHGQSGQAGRLLVTTELGLSIFGIAQADKSPMVRIRFRDNGPGIAPETLATIFDPFFTTKPPGQGTGLGLSICHGIVSEHGGHIWAESEIGQGTTFYIELPLILPEEIEIHGLLFSTTAEEKKIDPERQVARILVIDDEPGVLEVLKRILEQEGFLVEAVNNAMVGLELLKNDHYALILCDIRMPEMSGLEFYQMLELIYPELTQRVVFSTGDSVSAGTRQFLEKNALVCLNKPFELDELLQQVREKLEQLGDYGGSQVA
ncbi:MAG: PAS domain S-box protein [Chloroflexota bacterium]